MSNKKVIGKVKNRDVRNELNMNFSDKLVFTFANFKLNSINIKGEFNNYYKDVNEFNRKISMLVGKALPLLSNEGIDIFSNDPSKKNTLHLHKLNGKIDILEDILREYGYSETVIENTITSDNIYQLELPYENKATRIIFQRINNNLISFLFMDTNHHVYFNPQKVKKAGSLSYKYCPEFKDDKCFTNGYCFMKDVLNEDGNKVNESCDNSFEPANNYLD